MSATTLPQTRKGRFNSPDLGPEASTTCRQMGFVQNSFYRPFPESARDVARWSFDGNVAPWHGCDKSPYHSFDSACSRTVKPMSICAGPVTTVLTVRWAA